MIGRRALKCFNDAIVRAAGHDAQAVTDCFRRLMVRGIHGQHNRTSGFAIHDFRQPGAWFDLYRMCNGDLAPRFMIHLRAFFFWQKIRNVLDQRSRPENIQSLQSVTNS